MLKNSSRVIIFVLILMLALSSIPTQAESIITDTYSFRKDYDAIDLVAKSVFYVEMYDRNNQCFGSASGFIAFDEHLFITNEHVVDGASYIKVWDEDNKMYFIDQLIAVDKDHDIAILLFPEGKQYAALELDTNNDLRPGQPVLAIGSPKGFQGTVSVGTINALVRVDMYEGAICIQHTAPSSPGSSGGCLFADNGKVIGITSAGRTGEQVLNIAVPVHYLNTLYDNWNKRDYKALDSGYYRNDDSTSIDTIGISKDDFANVTGGYIETFVSIPLNADLNAYFYPMYHMTVARFLDEYDKICKTKVKNAPVIKNRQLIRSSSWGDEYFLNNYDFSNGIGTRVFCTIGDKVTLDVPINRITIFCEERTEANARACVAVFAEDPSLYDRIVNVYDANDCVYYDLYVAYLTKDGYLFLYQGDFSGARVLEIRYVVPY